MIEKLNPATVHPPAGYSHVTIATGGRQIQLAPVFTTASTLLGVTALGYPGQLVEIDLTAVAAE